jgi:aerobic-type carbon monoxide dehydrogenase small subunit (CoxS/CutS family)
MPDQPNPSLHRPSPRSEGTRLVAESAAPAAARPGVSRRSFIKSVGVSAAASSLAAAAQGAGLLGQHMDDEQDKSAGKGPAILGPDPANITLNINGKNIQLQAEPATTLLEALRLHLNMTGSKEICDRGACGGCSVIIDGRLVNSCMLLAMDCINCKITTVEGLSSLDAGGNIKLDPVQEMFVKHDAMQCGYCTPGFVVASRSLLNDHPKPTLEQIKRALSGNICRCGTYTNMFNAVLEASGQSPIIEQKGA